MKLALIPPIELLEEYVFTSQFQLMLPHLLSNTKYAEVYQALCADPEQYVILDNGAAERRPVSSMTLLEIADKYGVSEVVAPDVLGSRHQTYIATMEFVDLLRDKNPFPDFKVGYVAQGKGINDALEGVQDVIGGAPEIKVIHIPRLLITRHTMSARLKLAADIHSEFPDVEIHFLGANSLWCTEMVQAATKPYIRSIDTSLPFVYAMHQVGLDRMDVDVPHRGNDSDYFFRIWNHSEKVYATQNASHVMRWSQGMM